VSDSDFVDGHRYISLLRPILAIVPHRMNVSSTIRCNAELKDILGVCPSSLGVGSMEWSKVRNVEDIHTTYYAIVWKYSCSDCKNRPQAASDAIQSQLEERQFIIPGNGSIIYTPVAYSAMLEGVRRMSVNEYLSMWRGFF
jgi:hypothetical protein